MDIQRLRNLTTGRLHTEMAHVYQDLEFLTGMRGLFTHMLPNVIRATEPWLKTVVTDSNFWDGEYDTGHTGTYKIEPMGEAERELVMQSYSELPHPFATLLGTK